MDRKEWTYKRLVDISSILYGYPFDSKDFCSDSKYPQVIRIRDVNRGFSETYYKGEIPSGYWINEGDFLIGMDGEFNIARWGKTPGLLNQRVCKIEARPEYLNGDFMMYFMKGCLKKIEDETSFVTVKHLSAKRLSQIGILLPSLRKQESIANELNSLSDSITLLQQQVKDLDALAQSIFNDMFGDPIINEKGWLLKKICDVSLVKGRVGWKGYTKEDLRSSGPLTIGGTHITEAGEIDLSNPVYLSKEKYEESPEIMVQKNDLILIQRGTIGRVGLVKSELGEATINPCVLIVRPTEIDSVFLLHTLLNRSIQTSMKGLIRGVAQPMITQKQVNNITIPCPPLDLQEKFAERIDLLEGTKTAIKAQIEKIQNLLVSRMQYWFD